MSKDLKIPRPSKIEVEHYLKSWDSSDDYILPESSLSKLFLKTYPLNNCLDDVLIKICSLSDLYGLFIFSSVTVAKHIVALNVDHFFSEGDLSIVNKIADVKMNGGERRNFYSFATKYCSFHKPAVYPIFDSYVEQMLWYFRKKDKFDNFERKELRSYVSYKSILMNFRKHYNLGSFNLRQIDKYLYQVGKKYFQKYFPEKQTKANNKI